MYVKVLKFTYEIIMVFCESEYFVLRMNTFLIK